MGLLRPYPVDVFFVSQPQGSGPVKTCLFSTNSKLILFNRNWKKTLFQIMSFKHKLYLRGVFK